MLDIPRPSKEEVIKYLNKWDSLENYVLQENALDKLFFNIYPKNSDINDILIKCSSLNDFYSTNIFSIFPVAKHILNLNIVELYNDCGMYIGQQISQFETDLAVSNFYYLNFYVEDALRDLKCIFDNSYFQKE